MSQDIMHGKMTLKNAGGKFVDKPCVVDENLITSPHYKYVGEWMKGLIEKNKLIYIFIKGLITFPAPKISNCMIYFI